MLLIRFYGENLVTSFYSREKKIFGPFKVDVFLQFQIVHEDVTLCLDAMNWQAKGLPAAAINCHGLGGPQVRNALSL